MLSKSDLIRYHNSRYIDAVRRSNVLNLKNIGTYYQNGWGIPTMTIKEGNNYYPPYLFSASFLANNSKLK